MKRAVLFLLLNLTICAIYAQSQPVSQRLDALLNDEILKTSEVGITVFDLTTGESLYRYQDEKLYRPSKYSSKKFVHLKSFILLCTTKYFLYE